MDNENSKETEQTNSKKYEKAFYVSDKDGAIQVGSDVADSVRINFNGDMTDIVSGGDYTNIPYHKIITSNNISSQTVLNADTVDGKHAGEFVLKSGDTVTGSLKVNGTPVSETDVIRKKEMDSSLNRVNELLSSKAEKTHTHTATDVGAETPIGAVDKIKIHNADVNAHKAILDKKVNLSGGELKDTVATFNESTATEFPVVTSGGTLARILGDVKRNINSLVARVMGMSNTNLLINGDFQVWQRGENPESRNRYTADKWFSWVAGDCAMTKLNARGGMRWATGGNCNLTQIIQKIGNIMPETYTLSICIKSDIATSINVIIADIPHHLTSEIMLVNKVFDVKEDYAIFSVTASNVTVNNYLATRISCFDENRPIFEIAWVKLEFGSYATPFVPRLYGEELALCQRYYQVRTTNNISNVDIRPSMRTNPEIIDIGNNEYGYDAEIY